MNQLIVETSACSNCSESLIASDNFCRICGVARNGAVAVLTSSPLARVEMETQVANPLQNSTVNKLLNNRLAVIGLIATIGPLGLPALWFSPRFSKPAKTITTVVYFLLTAVLPLAVAWYCLDVVLRPLVDVMENRAR